MAKIKLLATSLRTDSFNKKLIENAARILGAEDLKHEFEVLKFNDYPMPVYDGDLETKSGLPPGVLQLVQKLSEAQALIVSSPEYNGGIAGAFKNAIDWVSRVKPNPWAEKKLLLLGASPGALGAVRGLWHTRVPLEALGVFVYPEMFGLPMAAEAFDLNGKLKDAATEERFKKLLVKFVNQLQ